MIEIRPPDRLSLFATALLLIMLFPICSFGDVYKWVDEEGVINFVDDIEDVPLKYRPEIISTKPNLKRPEISSSQKDWSSMTYEEKVEYVRRLKEKKIEEDRKIAGYPEDIQTLVRDHKLKVGITKEMVLLSWGKPIDIRPPGPKNVQEVWIYSTSRTDKNAYVYFENDILTGWEE